MNKKYLMRGFAALALVAGFSSCVKDVDGTSQKEIDDRSKENAEMQLGISIPDGQTWDMASQVEANVTVNGDYGAKYTVSIYENNPFINNTAVVLGKAEVASGSTANISFTCPDAATMVFAAIKDEKGYSYVKPATVKNGKVEVVFGDVASGSRAMRAASATNSQVDIPTGTARATIEAQCATILAKSIEVTSDNQNYTYFGYWWGAEYWNDPDQNNAWVPKGDPSWHKSSTNYVVNFKISGTWNGTIGKVGLASYEFDGETTNQSEAYGWDYNANKGYKAKLVPTTVYITNGGKWILGSGVSQTAGQGEVADFVDCIIIVGNGGELQVDGTLNMANLGRLIVLPGGRITGTGTVQVNNGSKAGEESYNFGTISVATFNENFGNFFNYGTMTCTELQGGAGTSCYVNHGKVHVDHVYPNGQLCGNLQIKNNCWWEVDNWNYCKIFQNGSGAYAKLGSFFIGGGEGGESLGSVLALDTDSKIVVENESRINGTLIYGPSTGNSAYLGLGTMTYLNVGLVYPINGKLNVNITGYGGDNATGFASRWAEDMAAGDGMPKSVGKLVIDTTVQPAEGDCAPTFKEEPPTPIYEELKVYTYAFEDQTVGTDYDMNDVVLKVSYKVKSTNSDGEVEYDKTKLVATLVAAGATYNIKVKIGETYLFGGAEIHEALGVNAGVMVNTGNGKAVTKNPVSSEIATPAGLADEDGNIDFTTLPVSIEVLSTNTTYSYPNTNPYPHAVMIPVDWAWPTERTIVTKAYPGTEDAAKVTIDGVNYPVNSFDAWAATPAADRTPAMNGWYNNPDDGLTMKNN